MTNENLTLKDYFISIGILLGGCFIIPLFLWCVSLLVT